MKLAKAHFKKTVDVVISLLREPNSGPLKTVPLNGLACDLKSAARQSAGALSTLDDAVLATVLDRYLRFLTLHQRHPEEPLSPTLDIDAVWHLHMLDPVCYEADCRHLFGTVFGHKPAWAYSPEEMIAIGQRTAQFWNDAYGEPYEIPALAALIGNDVTLDRDREARLCLLGLLQDSWTSFVQLAQSVGPKEWGVGTDCRGWTVGDQVAHAIGTHRAVRELMAKGPEETDSNPNEDSGIDSLVARNNRWVTLRRGCPRLELVSELEKIVAERLDELRLLSPEAWGQTVTTTSGPSTILTFHRYLVLESWTHEQDIRRATSRPGSLTGPVAEHCADQLLDLCHDTLRALAMPLTDLSIVVEITGSPWRVVPFLIADRRVAVAASLPLNPDVRMVTDLESFGRLVFGRLEGGPKMIRGSLINAELRDAMPTLMVKGASDGTIDGPPGKGG